MLNDAQRLHCLEHFSDDQLLTLSLLITMLEHEAENGGVDHFPVRAREPGNAADHDLNFRIDQGRIGRDHRNEGA